MVVFIGALISGYDVWGGGADETEYVFFFKVVYLYTDKKKQHLAGLEPETHLEVEGKSWGLEESKLWR